MTSSEEITQLNIAEQGLEKARLIHAAAGMLLLVKRAGSVKEDIEMFSCLINACGVTPAEIREVIFATAADVRHGGQS